MKKKGLLLLFVLILFAISGSWLTVFHADFETDVPGSTPVTAPDGDPPNDRLNFDGDLEIINSAPLGSKALKIDRSTTPPATILECITDGGPHTNGTYYIEFKSYAEADESGLGISVQSTSRHKALQMGFKDGRYGLSSGDGQDMLAGTYPPGTIHSIRITMNMNSRKFSVAINDVQVALDKTFLDVGFKDLYLIRFNYVPAIVEAFPGVYIVDDISIKKYLGSGIKCR
ncbi:MAG: hypothetical protein AMJ70_00475 [Dehalococcoidia bacterium SG8_51_3]|uniref:3-keto-disaccharide hydrolase domain-containing protein n=1 Tax=candidate division WOR_3 bacterium SM23_42 TaxID=1703779 RepID=A0A0S8FNH6_UNCW3|nr:MAG: hypothetical protein AMJ70_00475 [Dehalococcoidia bacterium SG8_51_3]KPK62094.1 MAG: hypothetical protein AMJ83_11625 [candidate division WOR_3 bacterium SM23_42]